MIRSLMFKNLGLKILSLCFAIVLWYSVVSERQTNLLVTVPLTFVNVPKAMKVRAVSVERISLHLEGPVSVLKGLEIGKLRGTIDLKGAREGKSRYELSPDQFNLPEGVRISGISPEVVYVTLERLLVFRIPVKPRIKGKVDSHYAIRKIFVVPKRVWVIGDKRAKSSIDNIPTEEIIVNGLKNDTKKLVALRLPRDIRLKEKISRVEVHIILREKVWDKEIEGIKVGLEHPDEQYGYKLDPETIKIAVRGWATKVDSLTPSDFEAVLPVEGLTVGEHRVKPKFRRAPEGVKILSVIPDRVKILVELKQGK